MIFVVIWKSLSIGRCKLLNCSNSPPPPCIPGLFSLTQFRRFVSTVFLFLCFCLSYFFLLFLLCPRPLRVVDLEICLLNMNLDRRGGRRHFYGAFLFPFCFSFLRYSTAVHCSSRTRPGPKVVHGKLIEKRRKKITLRIQIFHYLSSSKQFLQCTQCLENGNHQKSLILQHFKNLVDSWTTEFLDIWTLDNF